MWYLICRQPKKENIQIGETYVYKETTSYESEINMGDNSSLITSDVIIEVNYLVNHLG